MLLKGAHLIFVIVSFVFITLLLSIFAIFIKNENKKNLIVKIFAILTVAIHYSSLYVDFFKNGYAEIEAPMLLPIYPCNVAMWLLLIVAFIKNKHTKIYKILAEFTFYLGIVGGIVGILFNEIYASNPNLLDYDVLKGLLSHVTLIIGSTYLLIGKYIKIRVNNILSIIIGLVGLLVDGLVIISLYKIFNQNPPNCMFLLENPFPNLPWFNSLQMGILGVIIIFIFTIIYEQIFLKQEERFLYKIKGNTYEKFFN